MDKQIDESTPQESSEKPDKMVAPEDVTYSRHDEKKEAIRKRGDSDSADVNDEDETYLDKVD